MHDLLLGERQALILGKLAKEGRVIAASLSRELDVSEDTIRRDLREMAASGLCRRVYGGALAVESGQGDLSKRIGESAERKRALGRAVIPFIQGGMTVFCDAGSTNLEIVRALPQGLSLTLITNAPTIAAALVDRGDIDIVIIGGAVDHRTGAVTGSKATAEIATMRPDLFLLGGCGLDRHEGISATSCEEAEFKRAVALRSRSIICAITNEKLDASAPFAVIPFADNVRLVLEHDSAPDIVSAIRAQNVPVTCADPPVD
ncbi:DeoR/GlpR family DNA-binding transcription regulator [Rhizobium alvei]|uniref:DeoR/GlpR family DNA-binding transcription regulator n=1 Tax=Rhizobium alvei TaxID=1132659 RepID=A0ABT8YUB5_9HYPH|nr:DeoR/GlpR family DNA-binding transcription regulator [Rhizobium alvei]MDO6967070.1 DeoR/GlpR family DNA-binding transcription regulator [Rhizobium alvei]